MNFEDARKVADAVLFEGYVLYPYRASAAKNRVRWQFGVVAPRAWSTAGGPERCEQQTQCLFEADDGAVLELRVRFLHVQAKVVEVPSGHAVVADAHALSGDRPADGANDSTIGEPMHPHVLKENVVESGEGGDAVDGEVVCREITIGTAG